MAREGQNASKVARAHSVFVRLVLPPYTVHFKSPNYMQPATLDLLDKTVCKETLKRSAQDVSVREAIGGDVKFWKELVVLLRAAIPSLERRSFTIWDPSAVDYESTSGALIAGNYPGLWRDLERLNDLVSIGRNVLTIGAVAQDLAAESRVDAELFRLVNCCVRVTARGYDGDAGTGDEEKWQWIVNAYKKLLITSLQFLNNLVAQNEKRKLMMWVNLFDNNSDSFSDSSAPREEPALPPTPAPLEPPPPPKKPDPPVTNHDILLAYGTNGPSRLSPLEVEGARPNQEDQPFKPLPSQMQTLINKQKYDPNGYVYFTKQFKDIVVNDYKQYASRSPTLAEMHLSIPWRWWDICKHMHGGTGENAQKRMWNSWTNKYELAIKMYKENMAKYEDQLRNPAPPPPPPPPAPKPEPKREPLLLQQYDPKIVEQKIQALQEQLAERYRAENEVENGGSDQNSKAEGVESEIIPPLGIGSSISERSSRNDLKMPFTAEAGAKILESGKAELMKRLEGYSADDAAADAGAVIDGDQVEHKAALMPGRRRSVQHALSLDSGGSEDEDESEEELDDDDEEDYPGSSEDGRGLLTDVPLILGPSEIEVLPMLVMSGIVESSSASSPSDSPSQQTHTLRTHLLLSQTSGRNLLRELLIFVAAWDLREEELYFKFMVKIMEAILKNGLMPYAYHAFRDRSRSKDIISPAQAVIMKLLTAIFRGRSRDSIVDGKHIETNKPPEKVDLHVLNFIFTEFRQHIIPQTCALIFLQGQIHKGRASPDDFPLNLWDMERMYEGVYQYLEFFAVLTEDQSAKGWGMAQQDPNADGRADNEIVKAGKEEVGEGQASSWKSILADWEMASELVTLLRELEGGIPKLPTQLPAVQSPPMQPPAKRVPPPPQRSLSADAAMPSSTQPISVERPFDLDAPDAPIQPIFEAETPLAYPEDPIAPLPPLGSHDLQHDQDEPSDFEWRNLKKLTVLVLSSLLWKNKNVQDQVRAYGGLEALVGCCRHDGHNPYIREHAIMCLRFAVEGNEENAEVIRAMAAKTSSNRNGQTGKGKQQALLQGGSVTLAGSPNFASGSASELDDPRLASFGEESVPREVLDTNGYETFMDNKGQVGLRRKYIPGGSGAGSSSATNNNATQPHKPSTIASSSLTSSLTSGLTSGGAKLTAEKAAELMQNALRDLPLGDKLVTDRQKAEALARLDRAFEGAEKALGRPPPHVAGKPG